MTGLEQLTRLAPPRRGTAWLEDVAKIPAFFRRDLITLWSYRASFVSDWVNLFVQVLLFYYIGRLVPADSLPEFDGQPVSYLEYVTVAIVVTSFMSASLSRLVTSIRNEQLLGTLESLLITPTAPVTIQLGSVSYDLLYVPLRAGVFLGLVTGFLGVNLNMAGFLPFALIMAVFLPFLWGLGVASAAIVLATRHGGQSLGIGVQLLTLLSGAYFPTTYLPGWLEQLTEWNPITIALDASRHALLGDAGVSDIAPSLLKLAPWSVASLVLGIVAFRFALNFERRRGTLGLY